MEDLIQQGQYNIGHICSRFQCDAGRADKTAMRFIDSTFACQDFTFLDLEQHSNRFANVLESLGFSKGDIIFTFLPKVPEQFFAFIGALKLQLITGTLFSNFGEDALLDRLGGSGAKGLITKKSFLRKINRIRDRLPSLKYILLIDEATHISPGILSYPQLAETASSTFITPPTPAHTPSVLHYTSGSTGKPKGVLHAHKSVVLQNLTAKEVLSLQSDDLYWCTADQGWVTGTSYGIIGPWSLGVSQIHFSGAFKADAWFSLLEKEAITVWYTAPTALRMLMREDESLYKKYNLEKLKYIFSVGEPLNPELIHWARRIAGKEIYDTWFQTETGSISISNRPGLAIRPGSMGKPVSGITPAILSDEGELLPNGHQGHLCLQPGWHSMFVTYLNNDDIYREKFRHDYYFTGDTAYRDDDGYYWFMGRSDDVINTGGHLISPFEVESALLEIEEVAESGVIGVPDEMLFEKVVAYVSLKPSAVAAIELELKIRLHISNKVSSYAAPQELFFVDSIPKNKSGKIMRRVLKARYLGTDAGDISTLDV